MKQSLTLAIVSSCMIMGCNDVVAGKSVAEKTDLPTGFKIEASDIAAGLGMNGFYVAIPDGDNNAQYGFSYISKAGIAGCGFSTFKPGETIKVLYWLDGNFIRCAMIGKEMTTTSSVSLDSKDRDKYIRTSPNNNVIYKPGDIAAIWALGNSSDSGNGKDAPLRADSLALGVFRNGDKVGITFAKTAETNF